MHSEPQHYMEVNGQLHVLAALHPTPWNLEEGLGGPYSQSGWGGKERNPVLAPPCWELNPAIQPTAQSPY